jgi:hypothetical protein
MGPEPVVGAVLIVAVTLADLVLSAAEVAVMATVPPVGAMAGAVYVAVSV